MAFAFKHLQNSSPLKDFSITKLQSEIAKMMKLDLSTEDDDKKRAASRNPLEIGGGKLIITSRSVDVCKRIGCQMNLKVATLSMTESWELFVETLGHSGDLPKEIEEIAKKMTEKCDGLPLEIINMAASMRGVNDVFEWRERCPI
ncbi:putative disease resistance protein At3g15700 [Lycium barbarum]|uniref:putative disease resistance protein At3g15700 n=1 Tax=Lycium barbarum TaxID=112863 RepID=UPI00293EFF1F|nr:putative disease resistance protein At3g15700 [Lycium barbarum]